MIPANLSEDTGGWVGTEIDPPVVAGASLPPPRRAGPLGSASLSLPFGFTVQGFDCNSSRERQKLPEPALLHTAADRHRHHPCGCAIAVELVCTFLHRHTNVPFSPISTLRSDQLRREPFVDVLPTRNRLTLARNAVVLSARPPAAPIDRPTIGNLMGHHASLRTSNDAIVE
jgi:hypothetical protein